MNAHSMSALKAYQSVGLETGVPGATPQQLIVMLHEGAIAAIHEARKHLQGGDIAAKGRAVSKAITIIDSGLRASLDPKVGGALTGNLLDLYDYMSRHLLEANSRNDPAGMEQVVELLLQLKSAWETLASKPSAGPPDSSQHQGLDSGLRRNDGNSLDSGPRRNDGNSQDSGPRRNDGNSSHDPSRHAGESRYPESRRADRDSRMAAYGGG